MTTDKSEPLQSASLEPIKDAPVASAHGIAAIALNMALKYHDINTVQDGTLYQQYKMEGKNLNALHLDMVFETAILIERHLLGASERINNFVVDVTAQMVANGIADELLNEMDPNSKPESD